MVKIEKTKQVINALRNKYDDNGNAYAFMEQVGNATGWDCNRHADAIVVSLWKSRGLAITGFEVKVSRTDWLKELKHPEKADPIAQYCHSWYLVVGDADIVQFGDLPMNWGLMVPHTKNTLKVVKPPVINKKPKQVDMDFLCAILRKAQSQITDKAKLKAEYKKGFDEDESLTKDEFKKRVEWRDKEITNYQNKIESFEKSAGIEISDWKHTSQEIGNIVRMVLNGKYQNEVDNLKSLHKSALNCAKSIEEELKKQQES